jgi:hypothetical protein
MPVGFKSVDLVLHSSPGCSLASCATKHLLRSTQLMHAAADPYGIEAFTGSRLLV